MLKHKIQEDLTKAQKNKDQDTVDTLRLLMADIQNEEINTQEELNEEQVLKVLKKSVKKLEEAISMFQKGGREDLVQQNRTQVEILSVYLPPELSDEELQKRIDALIEENKELYEKSPKAIIGIAMKQLSSEADPKRIMAMLQSRT